MRSNIRRDWSLREPGIEQEERGQLGEDFTQVGPIKPSAAFGRKAKKRLHFPLIIFLVGLLFTVIVWDRYFNSDRPFDRAVASNLILAMGTLFSIAAGFLALFQEKTLANLEQARKFADNVVQSMVDSLIVLNPDATIQRVNRATLELLGYEEKEILGKNFELVMEGGRTLRRPIFDQLIKGDHIRSVEKTYQSKSGLKIPMFFSCSAIRGGEGRFEGAVCLAQDISERKRAQEQIAASLKEKEIMLKEIHHRVKNNLQVISSLLNIQSRRIVDPRAREIFKDSQNRVKSIALIHEILYQAQSLLRINIAEYVRKLTSSLFHSYGMNSDIVDYKIEADGTFLNVDRAIPCGLLINELVSNSLKHAFPKGRKGSIGVKVQLHDEKIFLTVRDDGVGLPEHFDVHASDSSGLQLVRVLVDQLGGSLVLRKESGTEFAIVVPMTKRKE